MIRELKCWPAPFEEIWRGLKQFEVRADDGGFGAEITALRLREWAPWFGPVSKYSGREIFVAVVSKLFTSGTPQEWRLAPGMVVMGILVRERVG